MLFKTKMPQAIEDEDGFAVVPPDTNYLSMKYIVEIPVTDKHFKDRWALRVHTAQLIEKTLGDEVQLTSLKVKKPHLMRKSLAKLRGDVPYARAYATVKF